MVAYRKQDFPVAKIRRFLEPGPVVLVSSRWKSETNIMTMGWQTPMEFAPSLLGCIIAGGNHSHEMIRRSRECVINIPTIELADKVVAIGNSTGARIDKFAEFSLTAVPAETVKAPMIAECYANLECRLADAALIRKYGFFIFEVMKAHAPKLPKYPRTIHYTGDGVFMVAGEHVSKRRKFRPENL